MYRQDDGGREAAGYKGKAGDCGARAIAIALNIPYKTAYKQVAEMNKEMGFAKSARNGFMKVSMTRLLKMYGWEWKSAPKFVGRKARYSDIQGTAILRMAGHYSAVVDGELRDSWDSSAKMVYGYWAKK